MRQGSDADGVQCGPHWEQLRRKVMSNSLLMAKRVVDALHKEIDSVDQVEAAAAAAWALATLCLCSLPSLWRRKESFTEVE